MTDVTPMEGEWIPAERRQASLVYRPHPLTQDGRAVRFETPLPGEYLDEYLVRLGVDLTGPRGSIKVLIGGVEIPRDWWHRVRPRPGSIVHVCAAVEGGDGSNPLAIVAMIVVAYFTMGAGSAVWASVSNGMATATGALTLAGTVVGTAMLMAGSMLVNALFPPPKPQLAKAASTLQESPTYSLSGGQNRMRPYEPLALVLGTHRVFFDAASKPYATFDGEDQYLYQLFHVSMAGPYGLTVTDLRIGDTPLDNFEGVQTWYADGSIPGNFPTNVDTVGGGQLHLADGWMTLTSSADTTRLEIDIQAILMSAGPDGIASARVDFEAQYRRVGAGDAAWAPIIYDRVTGYYTHYWSAGGYYTSMEYAGDAGYETTRWVQIDYGSNDPNEHREGDRYDLAGNTWRWRPYTEIAVYAAGWGVNTADPAPSPDVTTFTTSYHLEGASRNPRRRTWGIDVPAGQYEVRVRRTSSDSADATTTSDLYWTSLKSYQSQPGYYAGQAFLAVRVKASGQLNGTLQQLSGLVGMRTAAGTVSSNPADLFPLFAKGHWSDGRLLWGGGLIDADIDAGAIAVWREFCVTHKLTCDLVIDQQKSVWDILQAIARCGRGSPGWPTGKLGVVWDAPDQPMVAQFGMANIKKGSFSVSYSSIDPVEEVVLTYVDSANGWQTDSVRAKAPGVTSPKKTAMIELWGCVHRDMAQAEANLALAENLYRTRRITWEADSEGFVVTRGDVVGLSHDMTNWGKSGRLVDVTDTTHILIDQVITLEPAGTWIGIIQPDGGYSIHRVNVAAGGETDSLTLLDPLELTPDADGSHAVDWRYVADVKATPGKLVKVVQLTPIDMHSVRVTAVDEDPAYYAAESGSYASPSTPTWTSSAPTISGLSAAENIVSAGSGHAIWLILTWRESGDVAARQVRVLNDGVWSDAGAPDSSRFELPMPDSGTVSVMVTLYDGAGMTNSAAVASLTHTLQGVSVAPSAPTISAQGGLFQIHLTWSWPSGRRDLQYIEWRVGSSNVFANAAYLTKVSYPGTDYVHPGLAPGASLFYWARVVDTSTNEGAWSGPVSATVSADPDYLLQQLTGAIGSAQLAGALAAPIARIPEIEAAADWDAQTAQINRLGAAALVAAGRVLASAQVVAEQSARASAIEAEAMARQTVAAQLGESLAAVQESASATATALGEVQSQWGVQTQAIADGRKALAGVKLLSDAGAGQSSIILLADNFAFYRPGPNDVVPLLVEGNVNGVPVWVFNSDVMIGDLTVKTLHLANASVTSSVVVGVGNEVVSEYPWSDWITTSITLPAPGMISAVAYFTFAVDVMSHLTNPCKATLNASIDIAGTAFPAYNGIHFIDSSGYEVVPGTVVAAGTRMVDAGTYTVKVQIEASAFALASPGGIGNVRIFSSMLEVKANYK